MGLRFLSPLRGLPEELVSRFTHVDYKKRFGLAAFIDVGNSGPIIGVAPYAYDSEKDLPELAVVRRENGRPLFVTIEKIIFKILSDTLTRDILVIRFRLYRRRTLRDR